MFGLFSPHDFGRVILVFVKDEQLTTKKNNHENELFYSNGRCFPVGGHVARDWLREDSAS